MKKCPSCNQQFPDDLSFCLNDGTPLVRAGFAVNLQSETPTAVNFQTETPTVVATKPYQTPPPVAGQPRSVPMLMWLLPVAGLLLGLFVIGGYAIVSRLLSPKPANTASVVNSNPGSSPSVSPTPYPSPSSSDTPRPSPSASVTPTPQTTPSSTPKPDLKSYPATTRLNFGRGAVSTSFSGDLNPSGSRSLVLACRSGQSLTANVSSGGGCVKASYRSITNSGDNYVTLTNSCSTVTHFSVSVTVL